MNVQTIITCGSSIDMYPSFNSTEITICPYVLIDKNKFRSININIYFDDDDQLVLELKPPSISRPKFLIKLDNNSLVPATNIYRNNTYYLSFSSELTCRFSPLNNQTICFYYSTLSNFIRIEYYYDEITYPNLLISRKGRIHIYTFIIIIIIITTLILISIYIFTTHVTYKSRPSLDRRTCSDSINGSKLLQP